MATKPASRPLLKSFVIGAIALVLLLGVHLFLSAVAKKGREHEQFKKDLIESTDEAIRKMREK